MAVDIFLKLDGIKGESLDNTYKDQIDVLAWSWGMSQSGTTHMGSGGGAGKVAVQDLSLTKYIDNSSPTLMLFCCKGTHIKNGQLIVRKAGDNPLEYLKIDFDELLVASISTGGSGGEDRLTEHLTLNFRKFKTTYTVQTSEGHSGAAPEAVWDIAKNASA